MAVSREKIIHEKRLELYLADMPEYIVEYVRSKRRAKYSPSTLLGYVHEYIKFFNWLKQEGISEVEHIKDTPLFILEKLSKSNVEFYMEHLNEEVISTEKERKKGIERKRSEAAVSRNINALKSLFNYITTETENEDGECYFYRNVFSKIKTHKSDETASNRAEKISSIILSENEINDFINFVRHDYEKTISPQKKAAFHRDKIRDLALISVLLGSGIRVSEIASLTLEDINFQKDRIDIIRKGNKADTALVFASALLDLKDYLRIRDQYPGAKDTPYVFLTKYGGSSRPISVRAIQNLINKYTLAFNSKEEMFATGKGLSPHKLRHTFASEWIRNGGNIILLRDQLGHNTIETTQKYTNLSSEERRKVMDKMEQSRTDYLS